MKLIKHPNVLNLFEVFYIQSLVRSCTACVLSVNMHDLFVFVHRLRQAKQKFTLFWSSWMVGSFLTK